MIDFEKIYINVNLSVSIVVKMLPITAFVMSFMMYKLGEITD